MGAGAVRRVCVVLALCVASVETRAIACPACTSTVPTDPSPWPSAKPQAIASTGAGICSRQDPNVGASGFCSDVFFVGIDVPAWRPRWRITAEAGVEVTPRAQSGDQAVGTGFVSGGTYVAMRLLLGYDLTHLYFVRGGFEVRLTADTGVEPTYVGEMGTRIISHFELGFRTKLGFEGVTATSVASGERESYATPAFALGLMLFVRGFL
jgi:hypothetical protein